MGGARVEQDKRGSIVGRRRVCHRGGRSASYGGAMKSVVNEGSAYTPGEELANALTHGFGALLSVVGLVVLVTSPALRGDGWKLTSTAIFGASLVLLYTTSTLYHSLRGTERKRLLRKFDHAAIFLLIAGTYTPFLLVNLRGAWGWSLFGVIWGLAIAGVVLKFWLAGRFKLGSTLLYLGMGWLVLIAARPMVQTVPSAGLWLLLAGGLCYSVGTVFYLWKRLPYHHAIWHLFVLGGSVCHFFAVWAAVVSPAVAVSG
jgi:hemolysin III